MKLKFFTLISILTTFFAFYTGVSAQAKNEILLIDSKTSSCVSGEKKDCLRVRRLNQEQYAAMPETIENFLFEPGYYYVLDVTVTAGRIPPAGFPKYKYRLRKILARVKAEDAAPLEQRKLSGVEWRLLKIEGQKVDSDKAFIKFDETKNTVGGNGGCNGFGGDLTKNGYQIKISGIISTRMFCEETSTVENKFFETLEKVTKYEFSGGKLNLLAGERIVLELSALGAD